MIYVNSDIGFGSWSWDIPNKQVTFSPNWFLSLGYPVPKNLNQGIDTWERLIHPDDKNRVNQLLNRHLDGKTFIYQCVNRLKMQTGVYRENLDVGIVIIRNSIGEPLKMTGVDIDLSKTSFSQKELEDNTNQYKISKLTLKEIKVCEFIKKGLNDIEIAEKLSISPNTVKTHLRNICKKLSISGRVKLLAALYKNDLVEIVLPDIYNSKLNKDIS
jgi:DNA-binding CsgD family transcriptional regulator